MTGKGSLALSLCFAVATAAAPAAAQAPAAPQAPSPPQAPQAPTPPAQTNAEKADALFQEGKQLLEQGKLAEACEQLAQSDALDPTVSTIGLLAACHEQQGKSATALREYRAAEKRAAVGDNRADFARQRAAALEAVVPRLVIRIAIATTGLEVLQDQKPVAEQSLGAEILVDPGAHEIVARAPQHREWRTTLTLKQGDRIVIVPALAPVPAVAASAPTPAAPIADRRRIAAYVAGGLGLAGIGIGTALGVAAIRENQSSYDAKCTGACNRTDEHAAATRSATGSTLAFIAGGLGVGTGVVLLLLPRSAPPAARTVGVTPFAGPDGGGAVIQGRF